MISYLLVRENRKGCFAMARKKCDYCGEYYEEEYEGVLDNGCPACPQCVADEEAEEERKRNEAVEK